MNILKENKGFTLVELLMQLPFVLFGLLAVVTILQLLVAQTVAVSAAREAARTLAVYHDANQAVQDALNTVSIMPTGGSRTGTAVVNSGAPPPAGSSSQLAIGSPAQNPNYSNNFTPYQDVALYDDGTYCYAVVNYHVRTISPGLPWLMRANASPWSNWLNLQGRAVFKKEI